MGHNSVCWLMDRSSPNVGLVERIGTRAPSVRRSIRNIGGWDRKGVPCLSENLAARN